MSSVRPLSVALLWHAGSANNLGLSALTWSEAMLVKRAAEAAGRSVRIDLLTTGHPTVHRLDRLPIEVDVVQIEIPAAPLRAARKALPLVRALRRYDVAIDISAGDSFASMYGAAVFRRQLATKYAAALSSARLILAPQTLGPYTSAHAPLAGLAVSGAAVTFCRDSASAAWARRWPRAHVELVPDVGFGLPPGKIPQREGEAIEVGINPSGLLYHARPADRFHVRGYEEFLHAVLAQLSLRPDVRVHLVPHVVALAGSRDPRGPDEDYELCRELVQRYPRCVLPERFVTAGDAKGYIAALDLLLASRLHASIASAGSGVPVVAVAYSRKFRDTMRTVGYEPRFVDPSRACARASAEEFAGLLVHLDAMRAEVAEVPVIAKRGLDRYVTLLADQFCHVS